MKTFSFILGMLCAWFAALWLAWWILVSLNFLYPIWYQLLDIGDLIARVGPNHHFKPGLELCTNIQHFQIFSHIVDAVTAQTVELKDICYCDDKSSPNFRLLREPEVQHLQAVTELIAHFNKVGIAAFVLSLLAFKLAITTAQLLPPIRSLFLHLIGVPSLVALVVVLLGPTGVFYQWHRWVFPDDHTWFFYYQDSLMVTLMKAPDLFGAIAVVWLGLTLVLTITGYSILTTLGKALKLKPMPKINSQNLNLKH